MTDVGSTKASICAAAGHSPRFVGGHPMCARRAFDGATWFLTKDYALVREFVTALGATPVTSTRSSTTGSSRSRATSRTRSPTCSRSRPAKPLEARTLAARHDARSGSEPERVGGHLPRQPRRAPRRARRAPARSADLEAMLETVTACAGDVDREAAVNRSASTPGRPRAAGRPQPTPPCRRGSGARSR